MECRTCAIADVEADTPRGSIVTTNHWRVAHAFNTSLPGWLILVTREHVTALDSLDAEGHAIRSTLAKQLAGELR